MKNNIKKISLFLLYIALGGLSFIGCKKSEDAVTPDTGSGGGGGKPSGNTATKVMINGYIPDWKGSSFYSSADYSNLTIAYFAFVICDVNGNVVTGGTSKESKMESMIAAAHTVGTKAYLSFGGGAYYGSTMFYDMARNDVSRKEFAHQVKELCLAKGFDGFDVDWEGLPNADHGLAHEALMNTLKDTLHSVGLGLAVTVQQGGSASNFTYNAINAADLVQIMSYDATGTWAASPVGQHSSYSFASDGIDYWTITKGIAKSKLVLGVPFYGYRFKSTITTIPYSSIVSAYPDLDDQLDFLETGTYDNTYFNGYQTLVDKIALAYSSSIPGIMIWEMSQDATGSKSLLTRMSAFLTANNLSVMKLENSIP